MLAYVFGFAGIVGAVCELVIGYLVDRTRTKWGKIRPWIGFGVVPMAIVAMLVFIAPKTGNYKLAVAWMFIIYSLYTAAACAVESPAGCFGACCTPNPEERGDAISIASIFKAIGQSGGMAVLPAVGFAMGIERLLLLLEQVEDNTPVRDCEVFLLADPTTQGKALVLAEQIRDQLEQAGSQIRLKVGSQGSMKSQMKKADQSGAIYALIFGEREAEAQQLAVKTLATAEQTAVAVAEIVPFIIEKFSSQ